VELREELEPQLVQPSRCKAIAAARLKNDQVAAATLAPLLGADLLPEAWITPQPVGDLRALLRHRAALVRLSTRASTGSTPCSLTVGSPRTGPQDPVLGRRGWLASLELPPIPRVIIQDGGGLLDAWPPRSPGWSARWPGWPSPTTGPGAHGPARRGSADGHDAGRRDRRHRPVPDCPQALRLAGLPDGGNSDRNLRHGHITKQGSSWGRWILQAAAPHRQAQPAVLPVPTASWLAAEAPRSPPWRSPVGCWPAASTSSRRSRRPRPLEKARPGALVLPLETVTRPLT